MSDGGNGQQGVSHPRHTCFSHRLSGFHSPTPRASRGRLAAYACVSARAHRPATRSSVPIANFRSRLSDTQIRMGSGSLFCRVRDDQRWAMDAHDVESNSQKIFCRDAADQLSLLELGPTGCQYLSPKVSGPQRTPARPDACMHCVPRLGRLCAKPVSPSKLVRRPGPLSGELGGMTRCVARPGGMDLGNLQMSFLHRYASTARALSRVLHLDG
nr:hypothetical protein CFP56_72381 [Quercus suber]